MRTRDNDPGDRQSAAPKASPEKPASPSAHDARLAAGPLNRAALPALQRATGNAAVAALLNSHNPTKPEDTQTTPVGADEPVVQRTKDYNLDPIFGGTYNEVEITGLQGKQFIEQAVGSTASYPLGRHLRASTSGANSRRDGNFGVELPPQTWNYDSYKSATWDLALQIKTGGVGKKPMSMHNWAFSNIEVTETFEVVDGGTVAPGKVSGPVYGMDQKIPVVLTGRNAKEKVSFSEYFKVTSGWSVGREVVDSTTLTRSMSFGFGPKLEDAAKNKAEGEFALSSTNTDTISHKIATMGGGATTGGKGAAGETTFTGIDATTPDGRPITIRKYVYPVYEVKNFLVTAYPHNPKTAEVTGKSRVTVPVSSFVLARVESIDADADGKVEAANQPSPAQNAEDQRRRAEMAGREVGKAGGVRLKIALEREIDAQKDFDNQDFSQVLSQGETSRAVTKEWTSETVNQFSVTTADGKKVSGTGGWSLSAGGSYAGLGAKIGYSEIESTTGEFGDQVLNSGSSGKAQTVKVNQEVAGPAAGSGKNVQVIVMPIYRERVYGYYAYDDATGSWTQLPMKGRSKYYYPVGSVTTQDVPPKSELKPEGHEKLEDRGTAETAKTAKSLKAQIDAEKDPAKRAELERQLEQSLAKGREALEETVRRAHPSLVVIDRDKNLYEIEIPVPVSASDQAAGAHSTEMKKYRSTLEGLMDFTAPSVAAHNAADAMATTDTNPADDVTITSSAALGGTGAQGGVNPFPGDVDMSESIRIVAPTADAAADALAAAIQSTVTRATAPRTDGTLGYTFHGCMVGVYPPDAKKAGSAVRFTAAQTMEGRLTYPRKNGTTGTLTLAQAIAAPAAGRAANTYWRGPIDEAGTYGEITKVLNYDAVKQGSDDEHLFGTPKVGQSFQEVGFGREGRHDTERARLLEPLGRDIAKYAADGNWVKATKRAYTVARMLNDVAALNAFAPPLGSPVSQLKQLVDHIEMFTHDVVNPRIDDKLRGGIGTSMDDEQALKEAQRLQARMSGVDTAKDLTPAMQKAIDAGDGKMTRNPRVYAIIENEIVKPLNARIKHDVEFGRRCHDALIAHGYLKGK
ncbi:hypothetical protein [Gordonia rhizosphera]|uniref:Uncharacterized protein n=1 Tax=Gordonia rhizosphera NBRC 16068 TaxID=1108045 RepID=K6WWQ1_9ACTN|nr:hypothetical protein [Gordonia rhizosphera]GAB90994.1 hypothetical protein GORHZ_120_00500 [Gordonia rhizosphera NBRC 16068]